MSQIFFQEMRARYYFFFLLVIVGAIFLLPGNIFAANTFFEITGADSTRLWGPQTGTFLFKIAQEYRPASAEKVCTVSQLVLRTGASDEIVLKVFAGGSSPESGALLASKSIPASELSSGSAHYAAFDFDPCILLEADTDYWFVWDRSHPVYPVIDGYNSAYRNSNQADNTFSWQYEGFAFDGGAGWKKYVNREWSLKLEGPDPPSVSELEQFNYDSAALLENSTTTQGRVTLAGRVISPDNKRLKLEVELSTSTFTGVATFESELADSSSTVTVAIFNLADGDYIWQARAVDEDGVASAWLTFGVSSTMDFQVRRIPVLIVPGILGTELSLGDDLIWADLVEMLLDINDEFIPQSIGLDPDGNSINEITVGEVIEIKLQNFNFAKVDTFFGLRNALNESGYHNQHDIFTFPYDWRFDLENTKDLLKEKIDEIKTFTGSSKVHIIAHSMGGLLVKDYLDEYGKDSIDKLIFVGTPHLGAPKAGKTLLVGHNFEIPMLDPAAMKVLGLNAVSVYELLPNEAYFSEPGYVNKTSSPPLNYSETKDFLIAHNVNENLLDQGQEFFDKNLQDIDLSGLDVYNIAGCKTATEAGYRFSANEQEIEAIREISGDKTVPLSSADYINIQIENKFYFKNGSHAELPSVEPVRNLILNILQNTTSTLPDDLAQGNTTFCNIKGKELIWHSPVEVHVYDELNNHTGPGTDNTVEYNIPGVDYTIIGHNKFIFLPTDTGHTYRIVSSATGAGTFDLFVRENDNGTITSTKLFNDIAITTSSSMEFNVSAASADTDLVIQDGDITRTVTSTIANDISDGDVVITIPVPEEASSTDPAVIASSSVAISADLPVIPAEAGIQPSNQTVSSGGGAAGPGGTYTPPAPVAQVLGVSISAEEEQKQVMLGQLITLLQQLLALYLELLGMI